MQETPDSPEALATIPTLKLSDLERENKTIPLEIMEKRGMPVLFHDLSTHGIAYVDLGFNLHTLPQKYLPYVSLFGRALLEMGTEKEDFVTLTQRISRKTGGIRPGNFTSAARDTEEGRVWLFLRGKAMLEQAGEMLDIFRDVLLTVRLDNRERFRQMVLEEKARHEQGLVPNGHRIVDLRLRAHFNEASWASERMNGIHYLFLLRDLARAVDEDWPGVLAILEDMRQTLVNRKTMLFNVTLDGENWSGFEPKMLAFLDALPEKPMNEMKWSPEAFSPSEGMVLPTQVNYVGKGIHLASHGYRFHGSALVITRFLRTAWLWDRIRVQGGAYGAFCLLDRLSGVLTFVSYRDPNLLRTLEVFDQTPQFLLDLNLNEEELAKSIIGTIGDLDAHLLPDAKGYVSMLRHLTGDTDEIRQRMREEVLATRVENFKAFAQVLNEAQKGGLVKILGSQSAIQEAVSDRQGWLDVFKVL